MSTAPSQPAIDRFVAQLSAEDVAWLVRQLQTAQHEPPADWAKWRIAMQGQVLNAGYMPSERAVQMAEHLPNVHYEGGIWHWDTGNASLQWRSSNLQQWLWEAQLHGEVSDWRYEAQDWLPYADHHGYDHAFDGVVGLRIERAGFRHLGLRSRAVHVNGFTPGGELVVGLRSAQKRVDPGLYDNLMAGGISAGEGWRSTFAREMQEEAGLAASAWPELSCAGTIHTCRAEAMCWHSETLIVCNVVLDHSMVPQNQDGEVERFDSFAAPEVLHRMQAGEFTRDGILALALLIASI